MRYDPGRCRPEALAPAPRVEHEPSEAKTALLPRTAAPITKRRWLVVAAIAAIGAGVAAGVLVDGVPGPASLPGDAQSRAVSSSPTPPKARPRRYLRGRRNRPEGPAWTFLLPSRSLRINSWFRVEEMTRLSSTWPASPALSLRARFRRLSAAAIPGRSSRQIGARSFTSIRSPAACGPGPWTAAATAP